MELFSKNKIFENLELNTYCDRLYYFLKEHFSLQDHKLMRLCSLTGSVAEILAGKSLPKAVKDIDFMVFREDIYAFIKENGRDIFGVVSEDVIVLEDRIMVKTKYAGFEFFKNQRKEYREYRTKEGLIVKIEIWE